MIENVEFENLNLLDFTTQVQMNDENEIIFALPPPTKFISVNEKYKMQSWMAGHTYISFGSILILALALFSQEPSAST